METSLLIAALSMGFIGSFHCAGMCGPLVLLLPFQWLEGWRKYLGMALYHLGRITVYAALGAVLYSFKSFFKPSWQQDVSIVLGCLLMIAGLLSIAGKQTLTQHFPWVNFVRRKIGIVFGKPQAGYLLAAGMLNGMLPCGLVYMALSLAITGSSIGVSIATMYAFGLGTVPMLSVIIALKGRTTIFRKPIIQRLVPIAMFVCGGLCLLRGMNLGIPYLSPQMVVEEQGVKSNCCHH